MSGKGASQVKEGEVVQAKKSFMGMPVSSSLHQRIHKAINFESSVAIGSFYSFGIVLVSQ